MQATTIPEGQNWPGVKKNDFITDAFSIEYTQEHLTESIKFFAVFAQLLECNDDNKMK